MKTYIQGVVLFFIIMSPAIVFSSLDPEQAQSTASVETLQEGAFLRSESEVPDEEESLPEKDSLIQEEEASLPEEKQEDIRILSEFANKKSDPFHIPNGLKVNVKFWENIYSKYSTNQVIIHDSTHLDIIFAVVKIADQPDKDGDAYYTRAAREKVKDEKSRYSNILVSIHNKILKNKELTEEESRVAKLYAHVSGEKKYLAASKNIRSQLGLRERFLEGIKRSGMYIDKIKSTFKEYGLPEELTVLPHVESSFNYTAYSSVGAAGIWQFMRPTGRRFMRIDYSVDERRDPIASTVAAAKLLKENYEQLGNWPMAIIAYNHGLSGMKRAKNLLGHSVVDVIKNYKSRLFGFASRNFYAEFLAALKITKNVNSYFGEVELNQPALFETLEIKKYVSVDTLARHLKLTKKEIETFNPALRPPVLKGEKLVPAGYMFHLPKQQDRNQLLALYESIPEKEQKSNQVSSAFYKVRKGDSLYAISKKFKTNMKELMALNNIQNPKRIKIGQTLKLSNEKIVRIAKLKEGKSTPKQITVADNSASLKVEQEVDKNLTKKGGLFSPAVAYASNPEYGQISVADGETLGHYSDWSKSSTDQIRKLNKMKKRQSIVVGKKLRIPLSQVSLEEFESKRTEYNLAIQEDFFSAYKIESTETFKVDKGKTLWKICLENDIPLWLLKRYNPDKNLTLIKPGDILTIPVVMKTANLKITENK